MTEEKPLTERVVLKYGDNWLSSFSAREGITTFIRKEDVLSALHWTLHEIDVGSLCIIPVNNDWLKGYKVGLGTARECLMKGFQLEEK